MANEFGNTESLMIAKYRERIFTFDPDQSACLLSLKLMVMFYKMPYFATDMEMLDAT